MVVATGKAMGPWVPRVVPRLGSRLPQIYLQVRLGGSCVVGVVGAAFVLGRLPVRACLRTFARACLRARVHVCVWGEGERACQWSLWGGQGQQRPGMAGGGTLP